MCNVISTVDVRSNMLRIISILIISTVFLFCEKDKAQKKVEFVLLKSYQFVPGKCQVDASTATLETSPLVTNDDILWYSKKNYEYGLTANAVQKINGLRGRTAFAVVVDNKIVFLAVYMPLIMSSTCDHSITMDANTISNTAMTRLGYPSWLQSSTIIDDQRNNPFLLEALSNQGKLR